MAEKCREVEQMRTGYEKQGKRQFELKTALVLVLVKQTWFEISIMFSLSLNAD